ncbi:MAG: hypothetical protein ACIWVG_17585 [Gloeotrichia echinulata HAB0833]
MSSKKLVKFNNDFLYIVQTISPVLAIAGVLSLPPVNNPLVYFVYFILVVLLVVQFLAKETKKIRYSIRSFSIQYHDDLEIKKKDGQPIDKLTLTGIAIWNAGTKKFTGNDINNNPLIIELVNTEEIIAVDVLDSPRKDQPKKDNTKKPSELLISFDYLDPNEGASIQIIHTGNTKSKISLLGDNAGDNLNGFDIKEVDYSQSRASLSFDQTRNIALVSASVATLISLILVFRLYWVETPDWRNWLKLWIFRT